MQLSIIILIVAFVLSLPAGLFVAFLVSQPRVRFLGLLGGLVGGVLTALGLWYFVQQTHTTIDAVSWSLGVFLACSMGVGVGALLVGFLFGTRPVSPADY
jgi:hypothetical protein